MLQNSFNFMLPFYSFFIIGTINFSKEYYVNVGNHIISYHNQSYLGGIKYGE
jgi:hypothetical protein